MGSIPLIDLESIAKQLKLPLAGVQQTAELLEEANTVPFITRYRRDATGGFDEQQIRAIEKEINRARLVHERKETILKSIESRGQLTADLAQHIHSARSLRVLEDIYLPYKPKKQTLASLARTRGLEPIAQATLDGTPEVAQLEQRAQEFVNPENGLPDVAAVLEGIQHLVAESFGNHAKLRSLLRRHLWKHARLVSKKTEEDPELDELDSLDSDSAHSERLSLDHEDHDDPELSDESFHGTPEESRDGERTERQYPSDPNLHDDDHFDEEGEDNPLAEEETSPASPNHHPSSDRTGEPAGQANGDGPPVPDRSSGGKKGGSRRDQRRETRRRRRERLVQSFKDYFDFSDPIGRLPHHRILAINRGERTKVLRVRLDCDQMDQFMAEAERVVVPEEHVQAEFLRRCFQDAMQRLLLPSLEREIRRELNENAEDHAVGVFARNLRKLLLQPPLHHHRVVAVDPGFRSGCKLIALDEFGKVLGHAFIQLVGKEQQRKQSRDGLVSFINEHQATVIAIGNGTACRETEALVAEVLANELHDRDISYLIVNEAGASVYSTSELGREELPQYDATVRGAVSIGRRSLDPLSELVKIDPASIGVGLYQHDVKAKHLRTSLDNVVESCVNYVGVDVNSASPSLLRYVSGLNALTARRIFEYRQEHGPFLNREQLKQVSGIGESTYVQAAGFLKINGGSTPLDSTWIHPESYPIAEQVLQALGFSVGDLQVPQPVRAEERPTSHPPLARQLDQAIGSSVPNSDRTKQSSQPLSSVTTEEQPPADSTIHDVDHTDTLPADSPPVSSAGSAATGSATSTETATEEVAQAVKPNSRMAELAQGLSTVNVDTLATELQVGKLLLEDILKALARPGRDPREDLPPPIFRRGVLKLEDLKPGMELSGTVLNVVDFGAFVDIGLVDSGLIHVSQLADRYISDPHDVVSVGDILRVWVVEVEQKRRRVSLTAIEPGTERPKPQRRERQGGGKGRRSTSVAPQTSAGVSNADSTSTDMTATVPSTSATSTAKPKSTHGPARTPDGRSGGKRPSRPQRTGSGASGSGGRKANAASYKPKTPPKPVVPITKEMEEGKEPMRTFGDLKQLFEKRKRDPQ